MAGTVAVVEDLTVRRGRVVALDGVSCSFATGVTGVLGPNGAGKSTLFRVLVGLQRFSTGRVRTRGSVGYLPQDLRLYKRFTAVEILRYLGWVKGLPASRADAEAVRCLELMGLSSLAGSRVRALSGGMQQRLVIASAFIGDPDLVVLDEPTVGLDMEQQAFFRDLIVAEGARRAVVVSSHIATDIVRTCSRIVVLDRGRLVYEGSVSSLGAGAGGAASAGTVGTVGTVGPVGGSSTSTTVEHRDPEGRGVLDGGGRSAEDVGRFEDAYLRLLSQGPEQSSGSGSR